MKLMRGFSLAVAALLSACSIVPSPSDIRQEIGLSTPIKLKEVAIGALVVYYAKDGFTWEVEDRLVSPDTYRLTVRQGKLKTSGQGEAKKYFDRRAEEIAAVQHCNGYSTLEYNESLTSDFLNVAQRVTEGVIRCNH